MSLRLSEVDVDGIIVIGELPFVSALDCHAVIDMKDMKMFPLQNRLKSASPEIQNEFRDYSTLKIGFSGGVATHLVTLLDQDRLQHMLQHFFAVSTMAEVGYVNGYLALNCTTPADVRQRMEVDSRSRISVTINFLRRFADFMHQHYDDDLPARPHILCGMFQFGMKMPAVHFLNSIENMIIPDLLITSFIHLGVEVKSDAREIVSLHSNVKCEFGTRSSHWFHPLGLVDGVNVAAKLGSKLFQ